jgi:hypothetical protein
MGSGINICALLVGLAAFAGWTLPRFSVPRRAGWVNFLGGVGILALFFSIVSPDDDAFQQELIRPATPSVRASAHTRVAPRRSPADLSINAFVVAGDPIRVPKTGRSSRNSLLSSTRTSTFQSRSTPRQLLFDMLSFRGRDACLAPLILDTTSDQIARFWVLHVQPLKRRYDFRFM